MTIDEAIKQFEDWIEHPPGVVFSSELPAALLGIEALKKIKECQAHNCSLSNLELPGETE